jgi:hypothetical protein
MAPAARTTLHLEGVARGLPPLEGEGAGAGGEVDRLEVVLHDRRHAVQRADEAVAGVASVERVGGCERGRVDHDDRVDGRAVLVVRLDAAQVALHQLPARQRARAEGGVHVGDRRLLDAKGGGCCGWRLHGPLCAERGGQGEQGQGADDNGVREACGHLRRVGSG